MGEPERRLEAQTPGSVNQVKSYPLYLSSYVKALMFGILAVMILSGLFLLLLAALGDDPDRPPLIFAVLWNIGLGVFLYYLLSLTHRIDVLSSGKIRFVSLIRKVDISPGEIDSIKADRNSYGFLIVRYRGGKLRLVNQFDDFHIFLTELKEANPRVELRGC